MSVVSVVVVTTVSPHWQGATPAPQLAATAVARNPGTAAAAAQASARTPQKIFSRIVVVLPRHRRGSAGARAALDAPSTRDSSRTHHATRLFRGRGRCGLDTAAYPEAGVRVDVLTGPGLPALGAQ